MRFKGKHILVTGGAGFIGSNLTDALVRAGARVTVLDDLFTGNLDNISCLSDIEFINGSVTDFELVDRLVGKSDIVFNLAVRNIIVSTVSPRLDFQVNTGGIFNVLQSAKKHGIERVVYTSSASVYGNPRYLPINEDDRLSTLSPYAASKLAGENYCTAFYESYDVPVVMLRYSNVYGIKQNPNNPYCGVISKFFDNMLNKYPPSIHGDGEQTRDFTYVDDVVEATMIAAVSPKANGEVFNVASGIETSVNDLAANIAVLVDYPLPAAYIDKRDIDNIRRRVLNIEKIRRALRWTPTTNLRTGLKKTGEWLLSIRSPKTRDSRMVNVAQAG